jgi:hypothetical protein
MHRSGLHRALDAAPNALTSGLRRDDGGPRAGAITGAGAGLHPAKMSTTARAASSTAAMASATSQASSTGSAAAAGGSVSWDRGAPGGAQARPRARRRARLASSWAVTIRRSCCRIGAGVGQLSQRSPDRAAGVAARTSASRAAAGGSSRNESAQRSGVGGGSGVDCLLQHPCGDRRRPLIRSCEGLQIDQ